MAETNKSYTICGYAARDEDYGLFFHYPNKPIMSPTLDDWISKDSSDEIIPIPDEMFPNLKWDDEPIKVELSIKVIE